jgi:hypothetical protein
MEQETIRLLMVIVMTICTGLSAIVLFALACDLVAYAGEYLFLGEEK